jgi:uncharacterized membrane protein
LVELSLGRTPDHARMILRDSLPAQDIARHFLDLFLDYQNSTFYICDKDEVHAQLSLMYESTSQVSIAWFCQMFFIFAIGVQFDDMSEIDSATYHDIGQRYMDDAIDENPQSTIWVIRAMLLLCIYQPPTKWNSVWMHLGMLVVCSVAWRRTRLTFDRCSHSGSSEISAGYWTKSFERNAG